MYGLLWEYYATAEGLEVWLFRLLLVYRLKRKNIIAAHIIEGFNFSAIFGLGAYPWNTLSMGNRWRRKWIMLEKKGWPRFLGITPSNAEDFAVALLLQ